MSLFSKAINIVAVIFLIYYFIIKYQKKRYFISPFNLQLFKYSFALLIMPYIFEKKNESWYALGIYNAESMSKWLDKSVIINTFGYIIMILSMYFFEFYSNKKSWIEKKIDTAPKRVNNSIIDIMFFFIIPAWYIMVIGINGSLPLFGHSRTFFYNTGFSPIYQGLNELIQLFALHYGLRFALYKKGFIFFAIAAFTMLCTGSRGPALLNVIAPILIIYIYFKSIQNERKEKIRIIDKIKKTNLSIFKVIPVVLIFGIFLGVIRGGKTFLLSEIVSEMFYGNNFSDIRDGAQILRGVEAKGVGFLWGKTIFAGLISIIPSSVSSFKQTWAWGRFSTQYLFGMTEHFGMRGGNSLEAYINFGYFGVMIGAIFQGYLYAMLEKIFYRKFILKKETLCGNEYFIILIIIGFREVFSVSTAFATTYIDILFLVFLILISDLKKVIKRKDTL